MLIRAACCFALLFSSCTVFCARVELTIFAAASLTDALRSIAIQYERSTPVTLRLNFGASSLLARQIVEGAPADLFVSADNAKMDLLQGKDLIDPASRRALLSNRLVVVVPSDSTNIVRAAMDLLPLRRIALAEPRTVPAGIYAREYLANSGVWDELKDRIVPTQNVRAALAAVAAGNADAGIVFETDAAISKEVKVAYAIPAEKTPWIVYPAARVRASRHPVEAQKFLDYLTSPDARRIFEKLGFIVLGN